MGHSSLAIDTQHVVTIMLILLNKGVVSWIKKCYSLSGNEL